MNERRKTIRLNIRYDGRVELMRFRRYLGMQDVTHHCAAKFFGYKRDKNYKLVRELDGHVYEHGEILVMTDLEEYEILNLVEHPKGY